MTCTTRWLKLEWQHHSWRREVTGTEYLPDLTTNMWGRQVHEEHVICHKHEVCDRCGATREEVDCLCDSAVAERCAIRLACINGLTH